MTVDQQDEPLMERGSPKKRVVGDVVSLQRGNTYDSRLLGLPGPVLLGLASIKPNGGFRDANLKTFGGKCDPRHLLHPGDLYVSLKDVTQSADLLGAVSRVPERIGIGRLTQDTVKLVWKDDSYPKDLLYWVLRAPQYRDYCRGLSMGTTNLSLSREDFLAFDLPEPSADLMVFVQTLEALEDKIELNRRMNETLEAMARALFRSWFVDFDPVRAKSEGRPTGLPADLDTLFPSEFEDSPLGEIPKGWSVRPLDEIADFLNGLALQKFPAVEGEPWLPVVKIAQLRKGITPDCDRASFGVPPNYIIQNGDLLFSWSGSLEVQVWTHGQGALNQHLFKVTSKEFRQWFVYQWLMEHLTHFRHVAASKATTMGHIQRSHLTGALCVVPDERVLSAANDQVGPLHAQVVQNSLEAGRLASTRDELLPRLLSGEIEVADVEGRES